MKLNPGNEHVVDFDYFHLEEPFHNTNETALKLASVLSAFTSVDDVICMDTDVDTWEHQSTVGTGGGSMVWRLPNQGLQRMTLASHFASYGLRHYQSCYLSVYEYYCLKDLLTYLKEDYNGGHGDWKQQQLHIENVAILEEVCSAFRKAYANDVPEFLFEILKHNDTAKP